MIIEAASTWNIIENLANEIEIWLKLNSLMCPQKWLYQKGSMINEHRDIVSKALQHCQHQGKLNTTDITNRSNS